jgi:hypothetical protein
MLRKRVAKLESSLRWEVGNWTMCREWDHQRLKSLEEKLVALLDHLHIEVVKPDTPTPYVARKRKGKT